MKLMYKVISSCGVNRDFEKHKDAFNYSESLQRPKGVYRIREDNKLVGINISCDIFSNEEYFLMKKFNLQNMRHCS